MPAKKVWKKPFKKKDARPPAVLSSREGVRILFLADVRGALCQINALVKLHHADVVVHTGSFGFFDGDSADSMARDVLARAAGRSPVVSGSDFRHMDEEHLREVVGSQLSELPLFLAHAQAFNVPVYTIWGDSEDIQVVEKFRDGTYCVPNLHLVDEREAPLLPNTSIRLLGLPGLFKKSLLFNLGEGTTVPGTAGSTWAGIWQIGEFLHTAKKTFDPAETRVFLSGQNPLTKPLLNFIAMFVHARFTVAAARGPHTSSWSDSVVYGKPLHFTKHLWVKKLAMATLWEQAKPDVLAALDASPERRQLVQSVVDLLTSKDSDKNPVIEQGVLYKWNFSLGMTPQSSLVFAVTESGISPEVVNEPFPLDATPQPVESPVDEPPVADLHISDSEKARKEDARKEKLRLAKDKKAKKLEDAEQRPGLWFKNGDRSPDEILSFLAVEDRETEPKVKIKTSVRPDGSTAKVALVFFKTAEQASSAYERVDKDAAGTVSIYHPEQRRVRKNFTRPRKFKRAF